MSLRRSRWRSPFRKKGRPEARPRDPASAGRGRERAAWHSLSGSEAISRLQSRLVDGLSASEAAARLIAHGPNELAEAPGTSLWHRLLTQLRDFLVLILLAASLVSVLLGDYIEAAAIMAIVVLNAVLGVVQEARAEGSLAALRRMAAPDARVVRDGRRQTIPARGLVAGDIVLLEAGNYVPADLRLLEAANLQIDESSLTGESTSVAKQAEQPLTPEAALGDRSNSAFMSTLVTYGRGRGVVVATGMHTEIGLIAQMIQSFAAEPTPLQRRLEGLGRTLGLGALGVCALVFLVGVGRFMLNPTPGVSLLQEVLGLFIVAVSLAIAAVPEGLPAVVTVCLALGMQRMIQRHALLRRLPAVEALGSATVIGSDKTGTLTQNAMTAVELYVDDTLLSITGEGYQPRGEFLDDERVVDPAAYPGASLMLRGLVLCNDAVMQPAPDESRDAASRVGWRVVGDPTEGALLVAAAKAGYRQDQLNREMPRVAEIPFDSERKRMTTIHRYAGAEEWAAVSEAGISRTEASGEGYVAFVKGAPDTILDLCTAIYRDGRAVPLNGADRERIVEVNAGLAANALRVLGAAFRPLPGIPEGQAISAALIEHELVFLGLVGMIDPARPEVGPAIAQARAAGIKTVMITGDYPDTAAAIAREIGLLDGHEKVLTGRNLDTLDDEQLAAVANEVAVYARVSPEHKVRIVEALRANGHVVAMTGDGVNDAPALKRADIGVAMGITGTDVSKETAAMVLTDDNYASIVAAVEEGRVIYANIRKFVYYLLSCNVGEILIIFLATLAGWPLPLTAVQLLVLNLITDGAPALALGLEGREPDVMKRPPRRREEPIIDRTMVRGIAIQAVAITFAVLTAFRIGLAWDPANLAHARTMAFATLSISELARAYTSRSERFNLWQIGPFSNHFMQYAVLASLSIQLIVIYLPALDPIFQTTFLGLRDWAVMIPLILVPSIVAELGKILARAQG